LHNKQLMRFHFPEISNSRNVPALVGAVRAVLHAVRATRDRLLISEEDENASRVSSS
jgi:hypothetical protein